MVSQIKVAGREAAGCQACFSGPARFYWGSFGTTRGPFSWGLGLKGRVLTSSKYFSPKDSLGDRQLALCGTCKATAYRETKKKETRKWEFQGQILDMLWDCAKEWNSREERLQARASQICPQQICRACGISPSPQPHPSLWHRGKPALVVSGKSP